MAPGDSLVRPTAAALRRAAAILGSGGLVAFPTETVYGLGADALAPGAVRAIFALKGRPNDNPLIVHVQDAAALDWVAVPNRRAWELARRFWPGPLTLVLPRRDRVPDETTASLVTVAVRVPAHPVARALLRRFGRPVAAPSANRSGRPSPTRAEHVWEDFGPAAPLVLDGGACAMGVESTVIDLSRETPALLRPGGVPRSAIEAALGEAVAEYPPEGAPGAPARSPGMKHQHYAPRTPLILIEGLFGAVIARLGTLAAEQSTMGRRVGFLLTDEGYAALGAAHAAGGWASSGSGPATYLLGPRGDAGRLAASLFDGLRWLDGAGVDVILAEGLSETGDGLAGRPDSPGDGLGLALVDRLRRASGGRIERVSPA